MSGRFLLLVLIFWSCRAACQKASRDFRFGPSGQASVPLSQQSIFEATINGKGPFRFFFDTGANFNILNPEVIAQAGLVPGGTPADIHGMSGGKVDAQPYRADEVRIGDLTLTGQTFYSIAIPSDAIPKSEGIVGAMGYELMSRLVVTADNRHRQIAFYDPDRYVYQGTGEKLELEPDDRGLIARARIGKTVGDFVLDTGAAGSIGVMLNAWFVREHHLLHHARRDYHGVFSGGADGNAPPASLERIKYLCLGAACVPRVVGEFSDGDDKSQYAGRIGNEILRRFTLTIDWQHHVIYLEKASDWNVPTVYDQTGLLEDPANGGTELTVVSVYPRSPASKAHIKAGDRIVLIDNHPPSPTWYSDDPAFLQPAGTVVTLTIRRGNSTQKIKLRLRDIL